MRVLRTAISLRKPSRQLPNLLIQLHHRPLRLGTVRPVLLRRIIQMRQIDIEEIRPLLAGGDDCRIDNPRGAVDVRQRSPKMFQRKIAQPITQLAIHFRRPRVAPERFAAVGIVNRRRRANQIGIAPFDVQRKPNGGFQRLVVLRQNIPNLRRQNAIVPRRPHFHLLLVAPIKSVGNHAMLIGQLAGRHVRLHRASDSRENSA